MRSGRIVSLPLSLPRLRRGAGIMALALLAAAQSAFAGQAADILLVTMDKAKLIKYPATTDTIIIGNPIIADVTMLKSSGLLVVTGKGYGETNLVLLDKAGTILSEARLRVEPSDALLVVQRGADRETYACHPRCEPTVSIGDAAAYLTSNGTAITARNALASSSSGTGGIPAR